MNSTNLEVVITAKDEASAKLQTFSDKIKGNEKAFQRMAAVGTVAFAGVTAVIASSVKAYAESERNQRQLEHAIIGVSKGTQAQVDEVNKLSNALQRKAGIDGDALNAGVAQLSTFGLQSKSVVALTKSLADLTVNQKGVNSTTDDYIGSANTMAKALNGEFGALQRMGIRFTEAQQNIIQFGSETEKVKAIQEGFAQNLRETTDTVGGYDSQMGKLKQQFGEIQESIGKALQPALTKLAEALIPIITKISDWVQNNPQLSSTLLIVVGVLGAMAVVLGVIGLALPSIIVGFSLLSSSFLIITGIISSLILVMYNLWNITQLLYTDSNIIIEGIKVYWQEFVNFLKSKVLATIKQVFSDTWSGIKLTVKDTINGIINYLQPLVTAVDNVLTKLQEIATRVSGAVRGGVSTVSNWVTGKFAQGGNAMGGSTYMVGERGPELFTPSRNGSVVPNGSFGGGKSYIVNINGGTYLSREVANEIGDMIIENLKQVARI